MRAFVWNILLALAWVFVTERFTPVNLAVGFFVGYVLLFVSRSSLSPTNYFAKVPMGIGLLVFFVRELVIANFRMAYYVIAPLNRMSPGVVAVPLEELSDIQILILANLITLTPGTLTLDVSDDHSVLYVHGMDVSDAESFIMHIKVGFERRLIELFK